MPTIKELYREPTQVEHRYKSQVHQYYSLELFEGSLFVHKQSLQTHVGINANAFAEVLLATGSLTMNSICIIVPLLLCGAMILCLSVNLVIDIAIRLIRGEMIPPWLNLSFLLIDNFWIHSANNSATGDSHNSCWDVTSCWVMIITPNFHHIILESWHFECSPPIEQFQFKSKSLYFSTDDQLRNLRGIAVISQQILF